MGRGSENREAPLGSLEDGKQPSRVRGGVFNRHNVVDVTKAFDDRKSEIRALKIGVGIEHDGSTVCCIGDRSEIGLHALIVDGEIGLENC